MINGLDRIMGQEPITELEKMEDILGIDDNYGRFLNIKEGDENNLELINDLMNMI